MFRGDGRGSGDQGRERDQPVEATEIAPVERGEDRDAVRPHGGDDVGVVHLLAPNGEATDQVEQFRKDGVAIGQEFAGGRPGTEGRQRFLDADIYPRRGHG